VNLLSVWESLFILAMNIEDNYVRVIKAAVFAVRLRQAKRMSLGDSIVAATALEHGLELWSVNIDDFKHVEDLKLLNPLQ